MKKYNLVVFSVLLLFSLGCNEKPVKKNDQIDKDLDSSLIDKGKNIASSTFLALSSELQSAMKSGGVDHALTYCNIHALDLTDSLSNVHGAYIKRTSLKFRNPKNAPTAQEKKVLEKYESIKNAGGLMSPEVLSSERFITFYAPIIVQDMCLKCHGPKDEITNYNSITNLYPEDMAIDYKNGDLRGMWSIQFRKQKVSN